MTDFQVLQNMLGKISADYDVEKVDDGVEIAVTDGRDDEYAEMLIFCFDEAGELIRID